MTTPTTPPPLPPANSTDWYEHYTWLDTQARASNGGGAIIYLWDGIEFVLAGGQVENGLSPQWFMGGPAGAAKLSPLFDQERAGNLEVSV